MLLQFCMFHKLSLKRSSNYKINELPKTLPVYYKESFKHWKNIKREVVNCKQDINDQFVWYNSNIAIDNKTIYI